MNMRELQDQKKNEADRLVRIEEKLDQVLELLETEEVEETEEKKSSLDSLLGNANIASKPVPKAPKK